MRDALAEQIRQHSCQKQDQPTRNHHNVTFPLFEIKVVALSGKKPDQQESSQGDAEGIVKGTGILVKNPGDGKNKDVGESLK
jgi:hypothetical protein